MKKFILNKAPFIRLSDNSNKRTTSIMRDVIIALIPITIFGFIFNGVIPYKYGLVSFTSMLKPLLNVLIGMGCSFLFEGLYFYFVLKKKKLSELMVNLKESFAIIPGLILALLLPVYTDYYIIIFGCFLSNIVFKMLFGGFGHNIFNPALIGYVFCFAAFPKQLNVATLEQLNILSNLNSFKIIAEATPIALLNDIKNINLDTINSLGGLTNLFIGFKAGSLGEVSCLLCLIGGLYLLVRRVIDWRVPVYYIGTVFILSYVIGIICKMEGPLWGIWFPIYNILSGGLFFGAFFIATEPVTTPATPNGKAFFAVMVGVITTLIRFIIGIEGVATSILFVSLFAPIIDNTSANLRSDFKLYKYVWWIIFALVIMALAVFYIIYRINM